MIIYFAGHGVSEEALIGAGATNRLLSYAYVDGRARTNFEVMFERKRTGSGVRLFLDSGAFSVDSSGLAIDIQQYCDYIAEHKAMFDTYACLDVIGDWRRTARNYDVMAERGLAPLPVFHEGSPWHELRRLCRLTDYIGLGRLQEVRQAGVTTFTRWLDEAFKIIIEHWPVKVHLFGVTAQWVLERYPCYSADSSTSIVSAGTGSVQLFDRGTLASRHWADYARAFRDVTVAGSAHLERRMFNVRSTVKFNRYIDDLWRLKAGLVWGED